MRGARAEKMLRVRNAAGDELLELREDDAEAFRKLRQLRRVGLRQKLICEQGVVRDEEVWKSMGRPLELQLIYEEVEYVEEKTKGLHRALRFGAAEDILLELLEQRADPDSVVCGRSCCFQAAMKGHARFLESLCHASANVDLAHPSGNSPLYVVSTADAARILLEHGAKTDKPNEEGETPVVSSLGKDLEILAELIKARADVNRATNSGQTPLMLARQLELESRTAEMLLEAGARE